MPPPSMWHLAPGSRTGGPLFPAHLPNRESEFTRFGGSEFARDMCGEVGALSGREMILHGLFHALRDSGVRKGDVAAIPVASNSPDVLTAPVPRGIRMARCSEPLPT
ncbi:hypothetical protein GCM10010353_08130 [Streptomyces chryseus]|nr:hypothetical protein GCM10010353_08130 [Streptomyces chryseus]